MSGSTHVLSPCPGGDQEAEDADGHVPSALSSSNSMAEAVVCELVRVPSPFSPALPGEGL